MSDLNLEKEQSEGEKVLALYDNYIFKDLANDFSKVKTEHKLAVLQNVPKQFIKTRKVGSTMIPYIAHQFAEKCLNFAFNFNVSSEVISEEYNQYKSGVHDIVEAECTVKFTFKTGNGDTIIRTVKSGHKMYMNPAIMRADAMKSAISKAWTVVARSFGIGADMIDAESRAYKRASEAEMARKAKTANKNSPTGFIKKLKDHVESKGFKTIMAQQDYIKKIIGETVRFVGMTEVMAKSTYMKLIASEEKLKK